MLCYYLLRGNSEQQQKHPKTYLLAHPGGAERSDLSEQLKREEGLSNSPGSTGKRERLDFQCTTSATRASADWR
jgi:hypothetical protein